MFYLIIHSTNVSTPTSCKNCPFPHLLLTHLTLAFLASIPKTLLELLFLIALSS